VFLVVVFMLCWYHCGGNYHRTAVVGIITEGSESLCQRLFRLRRPAAKSCRFVVWKKNYVCV